MFALSLRHYAQKTSNLTPNSPRFARENDAKKKRKWDKNQQRDGCRVYKRTGNWRCSTIEGNKFFNFIISKNLLPQISSTPINFDVPLITRD